MRKFLPFLVSFISSLVLASCSLLYPANNPIIPTETIQDFPPDQIVTSPNLVAVDMLDINQGWGIGEKDILRTFDGGSNWLIVTPPDLSEAGFQASYFFLDRTNGWILIPDPQELRRGTLYRTSDSGKSWASYPTSFGAGQLYFLDDRTGWVLFNAGAGAGSSVAEIYATQNGGTEWEQVYAVDPQDLTTQGELPLSGIKDGISFSDEIHGWVTGNIPAEGFSYLFATDDGGYTWNQQELDLLPELETSMLILKPPQFFSPQQGKLAVQFFGPAGEGTVIYSTNNGGDNWIPTTPIANMGEVDFINMQMGFVWDGELFHFTNDGGQTWTLFLTNINLSGELAQLDFVSSSSGFALAFESDGSSALYRTENRGQDWYPIK